MQKLTPTQTVILQLLADGKSTKEIAFDRQGKHNTVRTHTQSLRERLGANNLTHAVAIGFRTGLIK